MPPIAFTLEWAEALRLAIDSSGEYRMSGSSWSGAILLSAGDRGVFLDLEGGSCLEARPAAAGDHESARVVFAATPGVWRELLGGRLDPFTAVLRSEVQLLKGSMMELAPHARSAREIFRSAIGIGASLPAEWDDPI